MFLAKVYVILLSILSLALATSLNSTTVLDYATVNSTNSVQICHNSLSCAGSSSAKETTYVSGLLVDALAHSTTERSALSGSIVVFQPKSVLSSDSATNVQNGAGRALKAGTLGLVISLAIIVAL